MRRPSRGAPRAKPSFAGRVLSADGKPPTSSGPAPICWNRSAPGARQDKRQATLWPFGDPLTTGSASGTELPCGQLVISTRTKHVWIPAETSTVLQCQVPAWQCNHGATQLLSQLHYIQTYRAGTPGSTHLLEKNQQFRWQALLVTSDPAILCIPDSKCPTEPSRTVMPWRL